MSRERSADSLDERMAEAVEEAGEALRRGTESSSVVRLQIAHSLSLALADAVAQTRRLQTLALAGQAAAQRRLLDGGDPETAQAATDLGHRAVEDSTRETLELARATLELLGESAGSGRTEAANPGKRTQGSARKRSAGQKK